MLLGSLGISSSALETAAASTYAGWGVLQLLDLVCHMQSSPLQLVPSSVLTTRSFVANTSSVLSPPSCLLQGSKSGKRFEIKKWNAVAMWSWAICTDTCAICRNNLYEPSIEYQANPTGGCVGGALTGVLA